MDRSVDSFKAMVRFGLPLLFQVGMAMRSMFAYARWPRLPHASWSDTSPSASPSGVSPSVSILVPARDEADNLLRLLPSLLCLEPPPTEILLIDDRSTDDTARIAAGFGVRVLRSTEPPNGWSGKNWALWLGQREARGEWLLFTDADTWHAPDSLTRALSAAVAERADLLSVLTGQECLSIWERLILPFAYGHHFAAIGPEWANDDRAPSAIANGQYLLCRREAYDRIGGHAEVRASLGEDVELACLARRSGARVRVYRAEDLVKVRMYRSFRAIQTGFRKYTAGYLRADPLHGVLIAASTASAGLPIFWGLGRRRSPRAAIVAYAIGVLGYLPWLRWFGVSPLHAPLQPLAYAVFQIIAVDATLRSLLGIRVSWKGRPYRA